MEIEAAILAGGVGTRLRPVFSTQPKALAPVNGIPFISYLLDQLAEAGASRVIVCTGHGGDQVRRRLELRNSGATILFSQEEWPLGTAGALRRAVPYFTAETVLALNGDSYVDTSLAQFREWRETQPFQSALLLTWTENSAGAPTVEVGPSGRILAYRAKRGLPRPGWIDSGVYLLSRAWLEELPEDTPLSLERDVLPYWIGRGIGAYCVRAPFLDIGTPESLAQASSFFASVWRRSERNADHPSI